MEWVIGLSEMEKVLDAQLFHPLRTKGVVGKAEDHVGEGILRKLAEQRPYCLFSRYGQRRVCSGAGIEWGGSLS